MSITTNTVAASAVTTTAVTTPVASTTSSAETSATAVSSEMTVPRLTTESSSEFWTYLLATAREMTKRGLLFQGSELGSVAHRRNPDDGDSLLTYMNDFMTHYQGVKRLVASIRKFLGFVKITIGDLGDIEDEKELKFATNVVEGRQKLSEYADNCELWAQHLFFAQRGIVKFDRSRMPGADKLRLTLINFYMGNSRLIRDYGYAVASMVDPSKWKKASLNLTDEFIEFIKMFNDPVVLVDEEYLRFTKRKASKAYKKSAGKRALQDKKKFLAARHAKICAVEIGAMIRILQKANAHLKSRGHKATKMPGSLNKFKPSRKKIVRPPPQKSPWTSKLD